MNDECLEQSGQEIEWIEVSIGSELRVRMVSYGRGEEIFVAARDRGSNRFDFPSKRLRKRM